MWTRPATTVLFAGSPATSLSYGTNLDTLNDGNDFEATVIITKMDSIENMRSFLPDTLGLEIAEPVLDSMMETVAVKDGATSTSIIPTSSGKAHKLCICTLPTKISRNNHPMAVHSITSLVATHVPKKGNTRVVIIPDEGCNAAPLASAVAKAFPLFSMKTSKTPPKERNVQVVFCDAQGSVLQDETALRACQAVSDGVQLAGRLVDTHPERLTTDQFAEECRLIAQEYQDRIKMTELVGDELEQYGGVHGVGKAATCPPRLVMMEYAPVGADETIALVGKGIVYDTGGLSLKTKTGMSGMKHDMGGAAGLLGGFYSAVKLGVDKNIHLILCLAENAIGPKAFRNDDILTMYSGKTVEVNNCDAEGRLVLADGVAHATKHIPDLDLVVDMATLTGAQLVATGKRHAGILANSEEVEKRAVAAGMHSGDLCFPLLYAPEFLMDEFKSQVADMKNSVKDRGNAQSSCAGHFIEAHLAEDYEGGWLHIDMAGPGTKEQRGTGFGVGLVLSLLEAPGF